MPIIPIEEQTAQQKMKVLRELAYQNLGKKWDLFQKIKSGSLSAKTGQQAGVGDKLASMRQSLINVTQLAHHQFRQSYLNCLLDISSAGIATSDFPPAPELEEDGSASPIDEEQDAIIISRTPLKFLIPCGKLREAGADLPQHRDGLIARIFFKVAAYYSIPENWDHQRITFYTQGLQKHSGELETKRHLEPLLKDIKQMVRIYTVFDGGMTGRKAEKSSASHFRESPEDQLRSMYWFRFTHQAFESFFLQYYLCLVTSTESKAGMRQLSQAFLPLLKKSILNRIHFDLLIDSDPVLSSLRGELDKYEGTLAPTSERTTVNSRGTDFETWNFNSQLLDLFNLSYDNINPEEIESEWGRFLSSKILDIGSGESTQKHQSTNISSEARKYALTQVMELLIQCSTFRQKVNSQSIGLYKKQLSNEKEFLIAQQEKAMSQTKEKIRTMVRAATKNLAAGGKTNPQEMQKKVIQLKTALSKQSAQLKKGYHDRLDKHRGRLKERMTAFTEDQNMGTGTTPKAMIKLADEIDPNRQFSKEFTLYQTQCLSLEYNLGLSAFYDQIIEILDPDLEDKVALIHATSLHCPTPLETMEFSEEETQVYAQIIFARRAELLKAFPDLFNRRVHIDAQMIPIGHLLAAGLDVPSFQTLLRLQSNSPNNLKITAIPKAEAKELLNLNSLMHPLGTNHILKASKAQLAQKVAPEIIIDLQKLNELMPRSEVINKL